MNEFINIIKKFGKNNKVILIFFVLISLLIFPIEAIGFSSYSSEIITNVTSKNIDKKKIGILILKILGIYIFTRVLYSTKYYLETLVNVNILEEIRNDIFEKILKKNYEKLKESKIGDTISKLSFIPKLYEEIFLNLCNTVIPYGSAIVVLTIYFYFTDYKIGLTITLMIIIIGLVLYFMSKKCIKYYINNFDNYSDLNENVSDKLSNISDIVINNKIVEEKQKNRRREKEHREMNMKSQICDWKIETITNVILAVFVIVLMYLYFYLFLRTKNKTRLVASFLIIFYLFDYIDSVKWWLFKLISNVSVVNEFNSSIVNKGSIMTGGDLKNFIKKGDIEINSINFKYNNKNLYNKLSCKFLNGKINGIFGKTGCGKTTLAKLILGLYKLDSGNIKIDNVDISKSDLNYLRDNISFIQQEVKLFNDTVINNLKYGNNLSEKQIINKINEYNLWDLFYDKNFLKKNVGVNGTNLSRGQRQKINILKGLLRNKKIVILDEPTSALDIKTKKVIVNLIRKMTINKTVIIISHDIFIKKYMDNIVNL